MSLVGLWYGNPSEEAVRNFSLSPEHKLETVKNAITYNKNCAIAVNFALGRIVVKRII